MYHFLSLSGIRFSRFIPISGGGGGSAAKQVRQLEKTWERDAERADSDHVSSISDIFESD